LGGNIWESSNAVSALSTCEIVTVREKGVIMGRWPNNKWIYPVTFPNHNTLCQKDLLDASVIKWTGAELVMRNLRWVISRNPITNHKDSTLHYSPVTNHYPHWGVGFFIQDNSINEWYYNPVSKKLLIYSTDEPVDVALTTLDTLIDIHGEYITIDNLSLKGANTVGIYITDVPNITIQNCEIDFTFNAISSYSGSNSSNITIRQNTINHTNNNAIVLGNGFRKSLISDNIIRNTGIISGAGKSDIHNYTAIYVPNLMYSIIQYNEIDSVGYNGISSVDGDSLLITKNLINHYCTILDDGGGIYLHSACTYKTVSYNIILNGFGQWWNQGYYYPSVSPELQYGRNQAFGIYIDDAGETNNINVLNNTIAYCGWGGISWGIADHIKVRNNTIFNARWGIMANKTPNDTCTIEIKNNIILDTIALYLKARLNADPVTTTLIDSNYYAYTNAGVLGNNYNKIIYPSSPAYLTLSQWQKYSLGQDASSSSVLLNINSLNDVLFYYNASKVNKIITLPAHFKDIKGNKYLNYIVLHPYASALLVPDFSPD
jgi:parallel beta-helix repeat protein